MAARVALRPMTPEEQTATAEMLRSRTAPVRLVERARIIRAAAEGRSAPAIAAALGCSRPTAYAWIRRFDDQGMRRPPGAATRRPAADPHRGAAGRGRRRGPDGPQGLGPALRLLDAGPPEAYLNEQKGLATKRSRIGEVLAEEGLRWAHTPITQPTCVRMGRHATSDRRCGPVRARM